MNYRDLSPVDDYTIRPGDLVRVLGLDDYLGHNEEQIIATVAREAPNHEGVWEIERCGCCPLPNVITENLIKIIPIEKNEKPKRNILQNLLFFLSRKKGMSVK